VTTAQKQTYAEAPTKVVGTAGGLDYAYRDVGSGAVPLVLLQHFRGHHAEFAADVEQFLCTSGDPDE
jgi:hypothetical protein